MPVINCILDPQKQATNFSNAFPQADLVNPIYITPPSKYFQPEWGPNPIIKLNNNEYRKAEAPRLWHNKLKHGLENLCFKACIVDPCLFIFSRIICV